VTKKKKAPDEHTSPVESVTTVASVPHDVMKQAMRDPEPSEPTMLSAPLDAEMTVNLSGDELVIPGRDDLDAPTVTVDSSELEEVDRILVQRKHLRGLLEALVFASDSPIKTNELAKLASAQAKQVKEMLFELKADYALRGVHLEEVAGGWVFRTSAQYAPFIRDLTKQKPVRLTRAQVETLAIIAYRQPITRPEVDDVRGVDSGPVLKLLLERDLVRILGKRDEPGRPLIYGTTTHFLEFFGLKSLKDLPTLREFTELTDESRRTYEEEIGQGPEDAPPPHDEASEAEHEPPLESMRVPISEDLADAIGAGEADRDDPTITSGAPAGAKDDEDDDDEDDDDDDA
jgi:segregation and condensation protein B